MITKNTNRMTDGAAVNVLDFGAVGDGVADDTVAIQAAVDYTAGLGGGTVSIPSGSFYITSQVNITDSNVNIVGAGRGVTKILSNALSCFWVEGTIGSELTATADYTVGDDAFTLASSHGYAVDDVIRVIGQRNSLSSDADDDWRLGYGTTGSATGYYGEFLQVKTQDGTTGFTTYSGLNFPDYRNDATQETDPNARAATTFQKVDMVNNVTISDLTIEAQKDSNGAIRFKYGYNCLVSRVEFKQFSFTGAGVYFQNSFDCIAENSSVTYGPDIDLINNKANYNAFKFAGSQTCKVTTSTIRNCSQGVDFTYFNLNPITLFCGMYDCSVTGAEITGATSHGGSYAITFSGNQFLSVTQGISCRSRSSIIVNNTASYKGGIGASVSTNPLDYAFGIYEGWARDCVMSGNVVKGGFFAGFSVVDGGSSSEESFGYTGLTCTGNTTSNCKYGFYRNSGAYNEKTEHSGTVISDNVFRNCYTRFIYLEGISAGTIIRSNVMDTLQTGADGILIGANTHPHTVVENNWIKDCGAGVDAIDVDGETLTYPYATNFTCLVRGNVFVGTNGTLVNSSSTYLNQDLYSTDAVNKVGSLPIVDGVTAPSATSGTAFMFIDVADGDLKIAFGDGVVKTITTDV